MEERILRDSIIHINSNVMPRNVGMTLLFVILTIIIILQKRFVQKLQHIRPLLRAHILI